MSSVLVDSRVSGGIATLTLQHPNKPNPITKELQQELLAALRVLQADAAVRALVLTGAGRFFCVGADLDEMLQARTMNASLGQWTADFMAEFTNPIVLALREMPFPVICAVNGVAAGAGAGLAMAGDLLMMARSAYLYMPFVPRLGLVPDMGITWFLPRRIGLQRATALALLGDRIGASQAVEWGLAYACVDDSSLKGEAGTLAERLAKTPPGAVVELRRGFHASERNDLADQLEYERGRQQQLIDSPAFNEGMQAFLEKREPIFHPGMRSDT